jgi:hypothetical protein
MATLSASPSRTHRTETNQEVKASTGITYDNFSQLLEKLIRPGDGDRPRTAERYRYIMDTLYSSVRLREWQPSASLQEPSFEIWNKKGSIRVSVTQKAIEIATGMSMQEKDGIRKHRVADGLDATALFNSIVHAQELIRTATGSSDADQPDDEFFKPLSEKERAAQLDAVLAEDGGDPTLPEDGGFIAKLEKIDADAKAQEAQYTIAVDAEGHVKPAPEKAGIKRYAPSMNENAVQRHLKSLQGRVLTIVDATLADKQQREAVKTLVNKEFRRELDKVAAFFDSPDDCGNEGEE